MSQAVKLPAPFYEFIRHEAQTLRRSMPAQLEYLALVGHMVEHEGLLNQEQIKTLLEGAPYDLLPAEAKAARLQATFDKFDTLPGNAALRAKLKAKGEPVAGMDDSGRLVNTPA